jgi:hypothetical protein
MGKSKVVTQPLEDSAFDYQGIEPATVAQIRSATERIRDRVRRTIEDIIQIGRELLAVKDALAHGQFGLWIRAEFGWTDRTARNFMDVAEQFGRKTEMISDLAIAPTAAYLLAAPSAPFEAREAAIQRARTGERVTVGMAKELLGTARKEKRLD